ncbi:universal stress protein [Rossellomorea aquimaris]|uniref:universal stress protein n=1 Tax=Rossellomorea aquimaris TaxID=189382 RepID=UPI001CD52AFF|nr:universal stress protein [Rossellomorea aquimaris]MCA1056524.1 universal stress protein [Rossellomorea aquimaris]
MYKHILLAYDETDGSKKALDEALKLTKQSHDTKLTILYVSEEKGSVDSDDHFTPTHVLADTSPGFDNQYMGNLSVARDEKIHPERQSNQNQGITTPSSEHGVLRNVKERLEPYHLNINYVHLSGSEAKRICEYAKENNSDLVLVGNSGKSNLKKWVLGSVSEKVAHNCETSVMVVK